MKVILNLGNYTKCISNGILSTIHIFLQSIISTKSYITTDLFSFISSNSKLEIAFASIRETLYTEIKIPKND